MAIVYVVHSLSPNPFCSSFLFVSDMFHLEFVYTPGVSTKCNFYPPNKNYGFFSLEKKERKKEKLSTKSSNLSSPILLCTIPH